MRTTRRRFLLATASAAPALLLAACLRSDDDSEVRVIANGTVVPPTPRPATPPSAPSATPTPTPTPPPTPEPLPFTPTPPPSTLDPDDLRGFLYPVEDGCLPGYDGLMPNAPRAYRNGVHEGVDWYPGSACAVVERGTPVYAMYDGVVLRADHRYADITPEQVVELAAKTQAQGYSDPETLDIYRGRQVWVDHGRGIVTRYAHLEGVAPGIFQGRAVERGDLLGFIGESGTPESVTAPGTEVHLHAEVRVGESFLGADLPPAEVRALYERLFGPAAE